MIIVTSEYIFINPKLNEMKDIITNTRLEHDRKYGIDCCSEVKINFNVEFFGKINNKTKNFTTKNIKKSIIASQIRYELDKINNLSIIIEGKICKNVKHLYEF